MKVLVCVRASVYVAGESVDLYVGFSAGDIDIPCVWWVGCACTVSSNQMDHIKKKKCKSLKKKKRE